VDVFGVGVIRDDKEFQYGLSHTFCYQNAEANARLIAAAPQLMRLAQDLVDLVAETPDDAPPAVLTLARQARDTLHGVTRVLEPAPDRLLSPVAAA